jgi:biotin carboxyl carrier protein
VTDAGAPPGPVEDALALVQDGQAKFASGEVDEARTSFAKALKIKPDDAGAKAGLERCERLLAERESPPAEPAHTPPPWATGSDDFPDSGEAPEATIVDPNYLVGMDLRGPDAGASGEFPEPLTVPRGPIEKVGDRPPAAAGKSGPGPGREPDYPRYVSTMPGNYPEVRPGGRPSTGSPPPSSVTPLPGPLPVVSYPQMPPGGPSAYPQYATPMGGYIPTPPPVAFPLVDRRRMMIIVGSVGAGCLLLGLLLGWAIFGAGDDKPKAGTTVPLVARDAGAVTARDVAPASEVKPTGTTAATARVSAIERPVLVVVTAPATGQVRKLHARAAAHVKAGARLYTIEGDKKAKTPDTIVEAPKAGRLEVRAAEGDAVAEGDVLALLVDPDAWLLLADLTGDALAPTWRCEVASGDGVSRSPCRIESVQPLGGGRLRATARVAARDAGWLKGDESDLSLTFNPP